MGTKKEKLHETLVQHDTEDASGCYFSKEGKLTLASLKEKVEKF